MLAGAIFAGGKSRRYGRNKALELLEGKSLIEHAMASLRAFCDPLLVIANDLIPYVHLRATLVRDVIADQGPLGGMYTALLFSPRSWVLCKATDMPFLVADLAKMLLTLREDCDVVVPLFNHRYEPLLALYSRRCLPAIATALEKGDRKITSFYEKVRVRELPEEKWRTVDPDGLSFRNVNTQEDLEQFKGIGIDPDHTGVQWT